MQSLFTLKYDQRGELYPKVYRAIFNQLFLRLLISLTWFSPLVEFSLKVLLLLFGFVSIPGLKQKSRPLQLLPTRHHHSSAGPRLPDILLDGPIVVPLVIQMIAILPENL